MASKTTSPAINGAGKRKCPSWIASFVEYTDNLDSPPIFRKWAAIAAIGAVLEQKVWLMTSSHVYANVYAFLVGAPGVGKTRTIRAVKAYLAEVEEFHLAPTSMSSASMVDALLLAKRVIMRMPDEPLEYNTMLVAPDEFGTFIAKYDDEMIANLSGFYDVDPYGHHRRGGDIKIKIKKPQLSILAGSTPSNLMKFMPENAWEQGFTSRLMLIFSDERIEGDDFAKTTKALNKDMIHDLKLINALVGEAKVTEEYQTAVKNWRDLGYPPQVDHPKLIHYATRRRVHLYKLSMIACIDRSNVLLLTKEDFNIAMGWLLEAEQFMPDIFKAGATNSDAQAQDEIHHFITVADVTGNGVSETKIVRFARDRVPAHSVMRVLEVMERAGQITAVATDAKTGTRLYKAT